jgi:transposase
MLHLGIGYHKRYSRVVAMDDKGKIYCNNQVMNNKKAFKDLLDFIPAKDPHAVLEAGRSWGVIYDLLEELEVDVHLAHPLKLRAIAEAKIKTDSIDAKVLADLLRVGLIPEVYVPPKEIRLQKNVLRQRLWLVKLQTMTKNRIHQILDRNHINIFGLTDLFGKAGRQFLASRKLPYPSEQSFLETRLDLLDYLKVQITKSEAQIRKMLSGNRYREIILSIPGFGEILSDIVALEIEDIKRFSSSSKLVSYVGLIPSTYGSAGKVYHGDLIPHGNRWLRYAFVEAAGHL